MPATAGRVRMPHNNRMSVSASLNTTGIWAQTIGHDPYSSGQPAQEDGKEKKVLNPDDEKHLLEAAKKQSVADGIMRDDFARKMYQGLKGRKKRRGGPIDEEAEAKARERENLLKVLEEQSSSSEDEVEYETLKVSEKKEKKKKDKTKKRKKEKKRSKKRRKYSSSDSDDESDDDSQSSDSSESSYERRKRKRKKKSSSSSKHRRKERKRRDYSSSDESDYSRRRSKEKRRRRERDEEEKKKSKSDGSESHKQLEQFTPSETFNGSKKGYVFRCGEKGVGYYIDDAPVVDPTRLRQQLARFTD